LHGVDLEGIVDSEIAAGQLWVNAKIRQLAESNPEAKTLNGR
jgi:hypothetical protein